MPAHADLGNAIIADFKALAKNGINHNDFERIANDVFDVELVK